MNNILYVSPTRASLNGFAQVYNTPHLNTGITHVIFVPRAALGASTLAADEKSHADFLTFIRTKGLDFEESEYAIDLYNNLTHDHETYFDMKSLSRLLREGLQKLPNLTTISVQNTISLPGLNASVLWFSDSLTEENAIKYGFRYDTIDKAVMEYLRNVHVGLLRLDSLFGALVPVQNGEQTLKNIKTLTIGDGNSSRLHYSQLQTDFEFEDLYEIFANLTSLTISSSAFSSGSLVADFWQDVSQTARNLEELTIFEDTPLQGKQKDLNVTQTFLQSREFPKLRELHLYDNYKQPGFIDADAFMRFAHAHRDTLDEVVLKGIFLCTGEFRESASQTTRACLSMIRAELHLSKFEMHIYRRDEHSATNKCTNGGWDACNGTCETYRFGRFGIVHRIELGRLAQDLNVFQHARGWDFGDFVMGPETAIGNLLKECGQQVDGDRMAGAIESERGAGSVVDKIMNALRETKEKEMADDNWEMAVESDQESAIDSDLESPVEGEEGEMKVSVSELDWDSDETMY